MRALKPVVVLFAVIVPVVAGWWLQGMGTASSSILPIRVAPAQPLVPSLGDAGIDRALALHQRIVATAKDLEAPTVLPVPRSHSAGMITAVAQQAPAEPQQVEAPVVDVDEAKKIALFFTGNEIGETDPCG